MADRPPLDGMLQKLRRQERRKLRARRSPASVVWFGLGMVGMVGWSVALPMLAGVAVGLWVDAQWPSRVSWTLTLLFVGLAVGCRNAWNWIKKESDASHDERHD